MFMFSLSTIYVTIEKLWNTLQLNWDYFLWNFRFSFKSIWSIIWNIYGPIMMMNYFHYEIKLSATYLRATYLNWGLIMKHLMTHKYYQLCEHVILTKLICPYSQNWYAHKWIIKLTHFGKTQIMTSFNGQFSKKLNNGPYLFDAINTFVYVWKNVHSINNTTKELFIIMIGMHKFQ